VSEPRGALVQGINLPAAVSLVVGSMIGSGIFIVSADIGRQVGAPGLLLLVWVITALITVMGALSQCELAAMYPRAGGPYVFLREGLGPLWGFLYGWTLLLVIQTGTIAAVAVAFARFLAVLVPDVSPAAASARPASCCSGCSGRRRRWGRTSRSASRGSAWSASRRSSSSRGSTFAASKKPPGSRPCSP
jgi:amino acid transporter